MTGAALEPVRATVVAAVRDDQPYTVLDIADQVRLIQQALGEVMIENVHYGRLMDDRTGEARLKKPILYKPGAELLCKLFKFRPRYEELGSVHREGFIAYRHRAVLVHYPSGLEVGEGLGSCNSRERKYAHEKNPWNIDNTLLKMSAKRALAAALLSATAASDVFDQAEAPVSTPQHRKLAALIRELEERHPRDDGMTWEEWTRARAGEIAGVQSRADLDAEEMGQLIEDTRSLLEELDKNREPRQKASRRAPGPDAPVKPPAGASGVTAQDPEAVLVDFGEKHNGEVLGEIEKNDPGYVDWLAANARNTTIRAAAQAVADKRGGRT